MHDELIEDLKVAYVSLENPNWRFADTRGKNGFHGDLVNEIALLTSTEETTDPAVDASQSFFLKLGDHHMTLSLSLVGKYACMHTDKGKFVSQAEIVDLPFGRQLLEKLANRNLRFLDESVFKETLNFGGSVENVYKVLFSEDELNE